MILHAHDELGVLEPDGHVEHAVVTEVTRVVWLQLDNCMLDVPFDPADSRLQPWIAS